MITMIDVSSFIEKYLVLNFDVRNGVSKICANLRDGLSTEHVPDMCQVGGC